MYESANPLRLLLPIGVVCLNVGVCRGEGGASGFVTWLATSSSDILPHSNTLNLHKLGTI